MFRYITNMLHEFLSTSESVQFFFTIIGWPAVVMDMIGAVM